VVAADPAGVKAEGEADVVGGVAAAFELDRGARRLLSLLLDQELAELVQPLLDDPQEFEPLLQAGLVGGRARHRDDLPDRAAEGAGDAQELPAGGDQLLLFDPRFGAPEDPLAALRVALANRLDLRLVGGAGGFFGWRFFGLRHRRRRQQRGGDCGERPLPSH